MDNFAGVDWAKEEHALCVLDDAGRRVLERRFAHDERGLHELCDSLVQRGVALVAIERPYGVLVERLLEAGLVVLAIHPNQAKAARPRFRAGGGKSDAFDAFVLAELARTDHHRFRALVPDSEETKALLRRSPAPARTWSRPGSRWPTASAPSWRLPGREPP